LRESSLEELLEKLLDSTGFEQRFEWPMTVIEGVSEKNFTLAGIISEYMKIYGLGARDAFQICDVLQTSISLSGHQSLCLPYFIPTMIGRMLNIPNGELPKPVDHSVYSYMPNWSRANSTDATVTSFHDLAEEIRSELGKDWKYYEDQRQSGNINFVYRVCSRDEQVNRNGVKDWSPSGYSRLLDAVGRFENPALSAD
jgi:hypothetical protein